MKLPSLLIACVLAGSFLYGERPDGFPETPRRKLSLNQGWRFHLGEVEGAESPDFDDSGWGVVHVPHTLELTSLDLDGCEDDKTQPTFHRKVGWYRRELELVGLGEHRYFLEFEGVHQVTDVWVNGRHAGQHAVGGYTPFHFEVTGLVKEGVNTVVVRADNTRRETVPPDPGPFDYVKFSGLYRDVYLVRTSPVRIGFNWESPSSGVFVTTPVVDPVNGNAIIDVKTEVENGGVEDAEVELVTRVIDDRGLVVLKMSDTRKVESGRCFQFHQIGAIEDELRLWSPDDPYLYRVNSTVRVKGESLDVVENPLGVRKFEHDSQRGFLLNNEPIELVGFNRHQHYGYIGDAVPDSLHYKDMLQFKQLGLNTVRTAHYPQDNALLDACDRLGILVYEEAPTWISISQNPEWWDNFDRALRTMIRNHRNHPSVVIWGAGVNHRGYVPSAVLACKQEDPTRFTASQSSRWTGWQTSGLADLYANMVYGPVLWDRSEPMLAMEGRWSISDWGSYLEDPLKTGLISWTAHAYYTFHPDKTPDDGDRTRLGVMSVFREPKRELPWYGIEFRGEPGIHIADPWTPETEILEVYSNTEEVELVLNGEPLMKSGPSRAEEYSGLKHPPFRFEIEKFEPGTLVANGLKGGEVVVSTKVQTPGEAAAIELVADIEGREFSADGSDIVLVYGQVVDKNGTKVAADGIEVTFEVEGPASLVGDQVDIGANPCGTRDGAVVALVRAATEPGRITVTAKAEGLEPHSVSFESQQAEVERTFEAVGPIYDFESLRVDLGAPDQLVQFGWFAWNGEDGESSTVSLPVMGEVEATVRPGGEEGLLRWLGEMNVIGKYGYAYGEGVLGLGPEGLVIEFSGLPEGYYRLRSWHHAPRSNTNDMDPNREHLRKETIHKIPYAKKIAIEVGTKKSATVSVSEGEEMQTQPVSVSQVGFKAEAGQPVTIRFSDAEGERGVWLNAFEISEWDPGLETGGPQS